MCHTSCYGTHNFVHLLYMLFHKWKFQNIYMESSKHIGHNNYFKTIFFKKREKKQEISQNYKIFEKLFFLGIWCRKY